MNQKVIESFDRAASEYERASAIQQHIASRLVEHLAEQLASPLSVFEIGCGTGHLTRELAKRWPQSRIYATDASEAMLCQARESFTRAALGAAENSAPQIQFGQFVAGSHDFSEQFDLIASSMTLQWIENPCAYIEKLCQWGNTVAFTIPVDGSFHQWIDAHESCGLDPGIRPLLPWPKLVEQLDAIPARKLFVGQEDFDVQFNSPVDFVRSLRKTGASIPRDDHAPVNLRRVFAQLPNGIHINYRIAFVILQRPDLSKKAGKTA